MSLQFNPPVGHAWADTPDAVVALRSGCPLAFNALVAAYQPLLLRAARVFTRSEVAAEEVVQETWLHVWQGLQDFEGRSSLRSWLLSILRNTARNHLRRTRRLITFSALGDESDDSLERMLLDNHCQWSKYWCGREERWPEGQLLNQETLHRLARAISTLPARQRDVLWSRDVEELSAAETEDCLALSPENQRVLLHRARKRLRTILKARH